MRIVPMVFATVGLVALVSCAGGVEEPTDETAEVHQEAVAQPCSAYVSTTGSDSNPGTATLPWRTIQYAVLPGRFAGGAKICVMSGTYRENVVVVASGVASNRLQLVGLGTGDQRPLIDGTNEPFLNPRPADCPAALTIYGQSHVAISNLRVTHRGNSTFQCTGPQCEYSCLTTGVLIEPAQPRGAPAVGCDDVVINSVQVSGIRTATPTEIGVPLGAYSFAAGGPISHLVVMNSTFFDNDTVGEARVDDQGKPAPIGLSALNIGGNVHDWLVTTNTFTDDDTGGVELAGNQVGLTLQPIGGVITSNSFFGAGRCFPSVSDCRLAASAVYNQGGRNILVERNFFSRVGIGVNVKTEPFAPCGPTPSPAGRTWIRDNIFFQSRDTDLTIGANDNNTTTAACNYGPVDGVSFTQNTVYRTGSVDGTGSVFIDSNPFATLVGANSFSNNIFMTEGRLFFVKGAPSFRSSNNYLVTSLPTPFWVNGETSWSEWRATRDQNSPTATSFQPTFISASPQVPNDFRLSSVSSSTVHNRGLSSPSPSWASEGFGAYTPPETDYFGERRTTPLVFWITRDLGADEY